MRFLGKRRLDASKAASMIRAFKQRSADNRQQELATNRANQLSQQSLKVRVNISGNRRGMHNADETERMRKLRSMRRVWHAKMPVLNCNNCQFTQQCPQYKAGYECAYNRFFDSHSITDESDIRFYLRELASQGVKRAQKMLLAETLSGAAPSVDTTEALSLVFSQLTQLHELEADKVEVEIGAEEGTIIGNLFGNLDQLIDVTGGSANTALGPAVPEAVIDAQQVTTIEALPGPPARRADEALTRSWSKMQNNSGKQPAPTEEQL